MKLYRPLNSYYHFTRNQLNFDDLLAHIYSIPYYALYLYLIYILYVTDKFLYITFFRILKLLDPLD